MSELEVRQLRYFVAVAEELHFGRAAERLGMAQPPLSRAIREIERQLGVRLLERTTRQVALTPAGEVLLRDAHRALDAVSAAGNRARQAGHPAPTLRVALKADYDAGLLPQILAAYRAEDAALPVEPLLGGRGEQVPALHDGRADVALLPTPFDGRGLDDEPLMTELNLVALAATDPLADRPDLCLADFAGRRLPDGNPAEKGPQPPHRTSSRLDMTQIFNLIEIGSIIWFVPVSVARRYTRPDIVYRPVTDLPPAGLVVAWPEDTRSPAVAAFVRAALAVASAAAPETPPTEGLADGSRPPRSSTGAAPGAGNQPHRAGRR
jgi:DNA-binding transcriptional LysR family regulator